MTLFVSESYVIEDLSRHAYNFSFFYFISTQTGKSKLHIKYRFVNHLGRLYSKQYN